MHSDKLHFLPIWTIEPHLWNTTTCRRHYYRKLIRHWKSLSSYDLWGYDTLQWPVKIISSTTYSRESSYFTVGHHSHASQNCSIARGIWIPSNIVPWAHSSPHPEHHHSRFSRFCRARGCDRQTDWQTARPCYSICGNRLQVLQCSLI